MAIQVADAEDQSATDSEAGKADGARPMRVGSGSAETPGDDRNGVMYRLTPAASVTTPSRPTGKGHVEDHSRPSTTTTTGLSSRGNWSHLTSYQRVAAEAYPASTGATSSRPLTSHSRTHVSSLTAQAFYRPMSSQRLQAQRNYRSTQSSGQAAEICPSPGSVDNRRSQSRSRLARKSLGSRPVSRATEFTDFGSHQEVPEVPSLGALADQTGTDGESCGQAHESLASVASVASIASLQPRQQRTNSGPDHSSFHFQYPKYDEKTVISSSMPTTALSSSILPSRHSRVGTQNRHGHEKLPSDATTTQTGHLHGQDAASLGKNYEYFAGNTVFCLGGRLQNARDRPINIATGLIIVLPITLFYAYSAGYLWRNVSAAIPILFGYISLLCLSSFWHASVTDAGVCGLPSRSAHVPGLSADQVQILPRNLHAFPPPSPDEDALALGPPTVSWTLVKSVGPVDAMEVPSKFCKTCQIWRPPRTHHCRTCDSCIETQDHHCLWLNNCIGRRNYRYFFVFVTSSCLLGLFLIGASIGHLVVYQRNQEISFGQAIDQNRVPFAMVIYGFLATLYPLALFGYHVWLMARGETTRECIQSQKFAPQDRHRPYSQASILRNWITVLNRPRPPTYLRFKGLREDGDGRFNQTKRSKRDLADRDVEMNHPAVTPTQLSR